MTLCVCVCLGRGHKENYTIANVALLSTDLKRLVPATLRCLPCFLKFMLSSWCVLRPVYDTLALFNRQLFRDRSEEIVLLMGYQFDQGLIHIQNKQLSWDLKT